MASIILGAVGTAIGGPIGGMIGSEIGSLIAETARLAGRSTDDLAAYDLYLRGYAPEYRFLAACYAHLGRLDDASHPSRSSATAGSTSYGYGKNGRPVLTKKPKLLLNDDNAGKPEGIHLMTGRRPYAAFGNSTGDRQTREYTKAGDGMRLVMLVLHNDRKRE
jgi:hypothetical protein